ncbi:MAG: polysaccharide biosynthesis C-terminal domain-containing protein, partial [Gammaproteobacteria bacterium]|nr:polysaccharide biosynthesis C-terminal domain-containing protein [Gammaproteobacteria bacterium]
PLLVLGALGTASDIGVFYAAHRTAALVGLILLAANSIIAPKFAALYHKRETTTLDEVMRNSAMFMTAAAAPAILLFFLVPEFVISIFGRDFTEGGDLLRVLAFGQMFNVITGSVGFMLMMTDNSRSLLIVTLSMVVVNVVLSFSLIPSYGAMGAAIAATASLLTASVMRVLYVWRTLGFLALPIPFSVRASSRTM